MGCGCKKNKSGSGKQNVTKQKERTDLVRKKIQEIIKRKGAK